MYDLIGWHRALHEITGSMALRWCRASPSDLAHWAQELRAIAAAMEAAGRGEPAAEQAAERAKASDNVPDYILEDIDL